MILTLKAIKIHARSDCGNILSITSTSFVNRFIIRPIGVVSKNAIGSRIVRCSMPLCNSRAACKQPYAIASDVTNSALPVSIPKPA